MAKAEKQVKHLEVLILPSLRLLWLIMHEWWQGAGSEPQVGQLGIDRASALCQGPRRSCVNNRITESPATRCTALCTGSTLKQGRNKRVNWMEETNENRVCMFYPYCRGVSSGDFPSTAQEHAEVNRSCQIAHWCACVSESWVNVPCDGSVSHPMFPAWSPALDLDPPTTPNRISGNGKWWLDGWIYTQSTRQLLE